MTTEPMRRGVRLVVAAFVFSSCSAAPQGSPLATSGSAGPSPSSAASLESVEGIAPYPGWTELARVGPDASEGGEATAGGDRPESLRHLLISAVCTGRGHLTITADGADTLDRTVTCPTPAGPERAMPYIGEDPSWTVRVVASDGVDFEVLIEGSDVPLHLPQVLLVARDKAVPMPVGCGLSLSLAWGYQASDSCGTTIPSEPIGTLNLAPGEAATIALDGWTVTAAAARCGRLRQAAGDPDLFEAIAGCTVNADLDSGVVRVEGMKQSPEPWLVEVQLAARSPWGDAFVGPFYAWVDVR